MGAKILISLMLSIFLISSISAAIILNVQPAELYNIGDTISIPIKISTLTNVDQFLSISLICNGIETEIHKEFISILSGEERQISASVPVKTSMLGDGRTNGICKIKAILGTEALLTSEFKISDIAKITLSSENKEFDPEQEIAIEGNVIKENGKELNGFIELKINYQNSTLKQLNEIVRKGYFYFNFSMPKETKATNYIVELNAYEKEAETIITNKGALNTDFTILQVPTFLELVLNSDKIIPGESLTTRAILHDQTGEKIFTDAIITIKDSKNTIIQQSTVKTDEIVEYATKAKEFPATWDIYAVSAQLTAEKKFNIVENEKVEVTISNQTLVIKNIGNVIYNKSVSVKIGDTEKTIPVLLKLGEEKKFTMKAPNGEYPIEVQTSEGAKITGMSILTGNTIDIKEPSMKDMFIQHPLIWLFIVLIMGFVAATLFKKGFRTALFGIPREVSHKLSNLSLGRKIENKYQSIGMENSSNSSLSRSDNKAELSLSIKGEQQDACIIAVMIKNVMEIKSQKGNAKETLQNITNIAEGSKAATYENNGNLFFIFAPAITKTLKNEETAVKIAKEINETLAQHNKMMQQKIKYGVGVSFGPIIAKVERPGLMKFMSIDNTLMRAKRLASNANEEVLLGEKMRDKVASKVRTDRSTEMTDAYKLRDIKEQSEANKSFIDKFTKRNEDN
jgi:hypothetical protein